MAFRHKPFTCPGCGKSVDAATSADGEDIVPGEGDLSVCLDCLHPFIWHGDGWAGLSDDELIALPVDAKKELSRVQRQVRAFWKSQRT